MDSLEISAPTLEEAIKRALEQLGVSREEVEINIVNEGKSGILGMGAEDATIIDTIEINEDNSLIIFDLPSIPPSQNASVNLTLTVGANIVSRFVMYAHATGF